MMNKCPECLSTILGDTKSCRCGWTLRENTAIDRRCHFTFRARRCPLAGTVTDGLNDRWMCSAHYRTRNDFELSQAVLEDIEINLEAWLKGFKNWRHELIRSYLNKLPKSYSKNRVTLKEQVEVLKKSLFLKNDDMDKK